MFKRILHGLVLLAFAVVLLFGTASPVAAAGIIYVDDSAAGGNNGSSWADAYTSLQSALAAAVSGDQVWVAAGTYKPTTDTIRTKSFHLETGVAIYGGFAGGELTLGERNPTTNVTVLSGDIGVVSNTSDNSYHVVDGSSTISSAILDGFTITDGNADSANPNDRGGGIYIITGASPTLVNLIVSANHATEHGGGMSIHIGSSPSLTNVTFSGNSGGRGGGMSSFDASPTLTDVTFNNNTSTNLGGGMYNTNGGIPTLNNVTFSGNTATNSGGGMYNIISNPTLANVTFSGNSAPIGGGMHNLGSNPTLTNVTFSGNTAGGAIKNVSSNPIIRNSILYGNTGGEIIDSSSTPVVTYSIVQGGYAGVGNLNADPLLGALANNGGFTQTMSLGAGSPAMNTGDNATCALTDQRGITRPQGSACDRGAVEVEMLALNLRSVGAEDGWVLESTETSEVGGSLNASATTFRLGDNAQDKQYRAILSFNTSALPDGAVITSVTLKLRQSGAPVGANPFASLSALRVDIRKPRFGSLAALEKNDFQAAAGMSDIGAIPNTPVSNWYTRVWSTDTFFSFINKAGVTQFRLRFTKGDNDNSVADYMKFNSGNHATVSVRPTLIIRYYVP